jgi:hypothetical protein
MKHIGKKPQSKAVFGSDGYQANLGSLNGERLPELGKLSVRPLARGGARPGAGRKAKGNRQILLHLSPRTIALLRTAAKRERQPISATAEISLLYALKRAGHRARHLAVAE